MGATRQMSDAEKNHVVNLWRTANSRLTVQDLATAAGLDSSDVEKIVGLGVIEPSSNTRSGPLFSQTAVGRLRRIVRLRRDLGINLAGIAVVLDLRERIESLEREVGRLRGRLSLMA